MDLPAPALLVEGLTVAYDAQPVLWNVDLQVPTGVMMGVVGPNGAGKSTLIKAVLGITPTLAGHTEVFGGSIGANRSKIAYVPQRSSVDWDFPTTVFDVVLMGTYGRLGWFRWPGAREKKETMQALEMVEMEAYANRQIGELSGGQQQRVFLARAFVQQATLYFMDEPFAGVDATTERAIVNLLHELRSQGKTLVVVHHDLATIGDYFDHVTLLNKEIISCGKVAEAFTSDLVELAYHGTNTSTKRQRVYPPEGSPSQY